MTTATPDPLGVPAPAAVQALEAGRDLDALVAEHVLGYRRWTCADYGFAAAVLMPPECDLTGRASWRLAPDLPLAPPSASVAPLLSAKGDPALDVIDALAARGVYLEVRKTPAPYVACGWHLGGGCDNAYDWILDGTIAEAPAFALAVARCALLCVPHLRAASG